MRTISCLFLALALPNWGQATNAVTNATQPAPPTAVPLVDVASTAVTDSTRLQAIQDALANDRTAVDVGRSLPAVVDQIDHQKADAGRETAPSLSTLRTQRTGWQMTASSLNARKQTLGTQLTQLDAYTTELDALTKKWQATGSAPKVTAETQRHIDDITSAIAKTSRAIAAQRTQLLALQNRIASQQARISAEIALIDKAETAGLGRLFQRDSEPLWTLSPGTEPQSNLLARQSTEVRTYVAAKFPTLLVHLLLFVILALVLFYVRREMAARAKTDQAVAHAAQVFEMPLAMSGLLVLLISGLLYPLAPHLFWAGLFAAALVPTVIILRRLIDPELRSMLYAMVAAFVTDQVRSIFDAQSIVGRALFLTEMIVAGLFLIGLLRSNHLSDRANLAKRALRFYAWTAVIFFGLASALNVLGYTGLSYLIGSAILHSGYLALILYAAVRNLDGLFVALLRIRPLALLRMVREHPALFAEKGSKIFRLVAFLFWLWETLAMFYVRDPIWNGASSILGAQISYGASGIKFSLGMILLFVLTVWVTVQISRLTRFVLTEEIFPKFKLGAGVPYTISTIVHYAILTFGVIFALNALNIHLGDYAILAGAFGVGLGFGLQNIMNNFVSGLILLFERPIKVGDVIQVDTNMGTVETIGIRASVIRLTNGSEIIMPNGNLISNPVTNWTFSNRQRVIDLTITLPAKSDPQRVMAVMNDAAKHHPQVLPDPPPRVLFTTVAGGAMNFELRAWTNQHENWTQIRSDLALAISSALARENIPLS